MKILVICSENYSISEESLSKAVKGITFAYRELGEEVLGFSPFLPKITNGNFQRLGSTFVEKLGNREYSILKDFKNEYDLFIRYDEYFDRDGVYGNPSEPPYQDNCLRFSFLYSAALNYCMEINFKPDFIHVHDWSGIVGALVRTTYKSFFENIPVYLTVHNVLYDFHCYPNDIPNVGLPIEDFDIDGYEFWGKVSMLKAAILYSDKVIFPSLNYKLHLLSSDLAGGMRGFLENQKNKLYCIQNGIDYSAWNIPGDLVDFKIKSKKRLKAELDLSDDYDLLMYLHADIYSGNSIQTMSTILANLLNLNLQLIIGVSENDSNYPYLLAMQKKYKNRIKVLELYSDNETLYKRLSASDILLTIYNSEPSSALFIKACSVGSVPIFNKRSQKQIPYMVPCVLNEKENSTDANSFASEDYSPNSIIEQICIAEYIYHNKKSLWTKLVNNAYSIEVTWKDTAKNYLLYYDQSKNN